MSHKSSDNFPFHMKHTPLSLSFFAVNPVSMRRNPANHTVSPHKLLRLIRVNNGRNDDRRNNIKHNSSPPLKRSGILPRSSPAKSP